MAVFEINSLSTNNQPSKQASKQTPYREDKSLCCSAAGATKNPLWKVTIQLVSYTLRKFRLYYKITLINPTGLIIIGTRSGRKWHVSWKHMKMQNLKLKTDVAVNIVLPLGSCCPRVEWSCRRSYLRSVRDTSRRSYTRPAGWVGTVPSPPAWWREPPLSHPESPPLETHQSGWIGIRRDRDWLLQLIYRYSIKEAISGTVVIFFPLLPQWCRLET